MATYNEVIQRSVGSDALVPEPLSDAIIELAPQKSAAMALMDNIPMGTKTDRLPVLDVLPVAYFVNGDSGLEQTTFQQWKGVTLVAEQIATLVPIPVAYIDDMDVPIWSKVQPRCVEAVGKLIDKAVVWGNAIPNTWGMPIYPGAIQAGNYIPDGYLDSGATEAAADFGQTVAALGDKMSQTGYDITGFAGRPGLQWRLAGMRSEQGIAVYQPNMQDPANAQLYGFPISMPKNGAWDQSRAQLIMGDWSMGKIGTRTDMEFAIFREGVISDDNGAVIMNLMQTNSVCLRLTLRLAYASANPVTVMQPASTIDGAGGTTMRWPFGVVQTPGAAND